MRKLVFILLFLSSLTLKAQLLNAMEMSFNQLVPPTFNFITPQQYENGVTIPASAQVSIISDQDWILQISSGGSQYFSTATSDLMPVGDLRVKPTLSGTWTNLATSNTTFTSGQATYYLDGLLNIQSTGNGNSTCGTVDALLVSVNVPCTLFTIDYKVELSSFYESGTYQTVVYYTLSPQ